MHNQIEVLALLQNIDQEIREKKQNKEVLLAELNRLDENIESKKSELCSVRSEWAEKEKAKQEKERILQEENAKAVEKRMRMSRIKNLKEMQALQREIDQIKQGNGVLEEEVIHLMEELEVHATRLKDKEEEMRTLDQEWADRRREVEAQLGQIDQAVADVSKGRLELVTQLAGDLIKRYELIFSRRGGTAVVRVSQGICQGCYMNIPPQLYNEIMKGERLTLCPSCQRILYYKQNATTESKL